MTANQSRYGFAPENTARRAYDRRDQVRAEEGMQSGEQPVVYVYGDRVCRKDSKQRQLYKAYGTAAGFDRRDGELRKKRYKIVIESIINLIDSIDERRNRDIESAKRSAIMRKKLIEHRRGLLLALFMLAFLGLFAAIAYHAFFGISTIYAENTVNYSADTVIAASGVEQGDKLYSFRADTVENSITFACPYIRSVQVERTVPNRVNLALESDKAAYFVNVYGEDIALSAGLRVLGAYDPEVNGLLTELYLPEISYSVDGRVISFVEEKQDRFVREILAFIGESKLNGRINAVDLRDAYNVVIICDENYLL